MHAWRLRLVRGAAAVAVLALLGRLSLWQWERGRSSGRLLHYTYAVEWLLVAVLLAAVVLGHRRRSRVDPPDVHDVAGRVIGPPLLPGEQLPATTRDRVLARFRRRTADGADA